MQEAGQWHTNLLAVNYPLIFLLYSHLGWLGHSPEFLPGVLGERDLRTFAITHAAPPEKFREMTGLQSMSEISMKKTRSYDKQRNTHIGQMKTMAATGKSSFNRWYSETYSTELIHPCASPSKLGQILHMTNSDGWGINRVLLLSVALHFYWPYRRS